MSRWSEADKLYMRRALELAARASGRTCPNPVVGAVIVKDGEVVGEGYHEKAGKDHAEVVALKQADDRAKGATLYVTLEPCCHWGRTPPCTRAIIAAGITRVVVATPDCDDRVCNMGIAELRAAGVQVEVGLMRKVAERLNECFIKHVTSRMPFVVLKIATSLDGKIATVTGESKWITCEEARIEGHRLRDQLDAVMVGIGTVLADDPSLTTRLPDGQGRDPIRVIVDSKGRTPTNARVLTQESAAPTIIAVTNSAPDDRISALKSAGAEIMRVEPDDSGRVNLRSLLAKLAAYPIQGVLVEGGSELAGSLIRERLVDKVVAFIAPKIIGGRDAPSSVGGDGIWELRNAIQLEDLTVKRVGTDLMVQGYVVKSKTEGEDA